VPVRVRLVGGIGDEFLQAGLDDGLCALDAGKPGNVDRAALERNPDACSVENGVLLGMAAPSVFCAGYAGVAVCTENLNTGVAVMKFAQDGA
jgi:hypothetical protein